MAIPVCPNCGEDTDLTGAPAGEGIRLTCGNCGHDWERDMRPTCPTCGRTDVRPVPVAIIDKSRGTQLSMHGTRTEHLCRDCDADDIARWLKHLPNPLLPKGDLPTADGRI